MLKIVHGYKKVCKSITNGQDTSESQKMDIGVVGCGWGGVIGTSGRVIVKVDFCYVVSF